MKMFYQRRQFGPFSVYLVIGDVGASQIVKVTEAHVRADHRNAVAVISGAGRVVSPSGAEWALTAGLIDLEMPDYVDVGDYRYEAISKLRFFCCARVDREPLKREAFETSIPITIPEGSVAMCVQGAAALLDVDADAIAPFIVDGTEKTRTILPIGTIKGLILLP